MAGMAAQLLKHAFKMNRMRIVLFIAALLATSELLARQASTPPTPQLPPSEVLQQFRATAFPGVVVLREGIVRANLPLLGDVSKRLAVSVLGPIAPEPKSKSYPHR
jgi:hypothetical protein